MKRLSVFAMLALAVAQAAPAQTAAMQQVLVPREIYVGDRAELRYMFQSATDFFALADAGRLSGDAVQLDTEAEVFLSHGEDCAVQRAVLHRVGITYTLILSFVPWRTGEIDFAPFNVSELCGAGKDAPAYMVDLAPVTVSSLVQKTGVSSLRAPVAPLLLPGTNYVLWSLIIAAILLLVLLGVAAARFSSIILFLQSLREYVGYYRNASRTRKALALLAKSEGYTDVVFAEEWQRIMRGYLEYRFRSSFASVTARRLAEVVAVATGNLLEMEQENAVLSLQSLFVRTDYIRYAAGSVDSRQLPAAEHEALFAKDERQNIVELTCMDIADLEARGREV